jgi:hypothetical protein
MKQKIQPRLKTGGRLDSNDVSLCFGVVILSGVRCIPAPESPLSSETNMVGCHSERSEESPLSSETKTVVPTPNWLDTPIVP